MTYANEPDTNLIAIAEKQQAFIAIQNDTIRRLMALIANECPIQVVEKSTDIGYRALEKMALYM